MVPDPTVPPCSERSEPIHKRSQLCLLHWTAPRHPLTLTREGSYNSLENLVKGKIYCPHQESNHDYLNNLVQSLQ